MVVLSVGWWVRSGGEHRTKLQAFSPGTRARSAALGGTNEPYTPVPVYVRLTGSGEGRGRGEGVACED